MTSEHLASLIDELIHRLIYGAIGDGSRQGRMTRLSILNDEIALVGSLSSYLSMLLIPFASTNISTL